MNSPPDGDPDGRPGSDLLPAATGPVSDGSSAPAGMAVITSSSEFPPSEPGDWPQWARAGTNVSQPRQHRPADAIWLSRLEVAWSAWRARSPSQRVPAGPCMAKVAVTATCASIVASLATMWLSAPAGSRPADVVAISNKPLGTIEPLPTIGEPQSARLAALPAAVGGELRVPSAPRAPAAPQTPTLPAATRGPGRSEAAAPAAAAEPVAAPAAPVIVVITEPEGARVTINGLAYGTTPLTIRDFPPGAKRIRVTKDGYDGEERVVEAAAARSGITLRIELREAGPGTRR